MKKIKLILGLLFFALFIGMSSLSAQPGNPPDNPDGTAGGTPIGGSAPAGGGVFLLAGFVLAYAGKKAFDARKKSEEQE